jgi:hypothetical protein
VRFYIWERSGSYAASALRSTGAMLGMAGGAIFALAMAISLEQSSSSPHCMAYCYSGSSMSLLLILVGIMLQIIQKNAHTKDFFLKPKFFKTQ